MCHLMIVDDETSVVDSLALTIPWKEHGIEEVFRAYSVQEALQIAAEYSIDVLITDIQMPEMDGFELIEQLSQFAPRSKNIILSGHDDFKYAQKAIKHQTIDYLLKPVNIKELIKTVEKAIRNIEKELDKTKSYQRMKHTLDINMPVLKNQLLNHLLKGKKTEPNILARRLAAIETSFQSGDSFIMMVIGIEDGFSSYDLQSMSLIKFAVTNITEEVFFEQFELWGCITEQGYLVYLIKSNDRENLKLVDSYVKKLQSYVETLLKGSLTVCRSNTGVFPHDLNEKYQTVMTSVYHNPEIKKDHITNVGNLPEYQSSGIINFHEAPTIKSLLELRDWEGALARISHILSINDEKSNPSQNHLFEALLYLSSTFSAFLHAKDGRLDDLLGEGFNFLMKNRSFISKQRVLGWSKKMIDTMKGTSHYIDDSQQRIVTLVQAFIHEHLSDDTSLQRIAEEVDLHPVYLSKVYKDTTNETIGDYIYHLRMDRANFLLGNTKLRISDISQELGFLSQSHFIKVFKKHYGCTPQQYRQQKLVVSSTSSGERIE